MGCVCITDFGELKNDDIVVVRAHGETKDFLIELITLGLNVLMQHVQM